MALIVKLAEDDVPDSERVVAESVAAALPPHRTTKILVTKVFPEQRTGRRARLFSVELPGLSQQELRRVVEVVGQAKGIEYAEIPPVKKLI